MFLPMFNVYLFMCSICTLCSMFVSVSYGMVSAVGVFYAGGVVLCSTEKPSNWSVRNHNRNYKTKALGRPNSLCTASGTFYHILEHSRACRSLTHTDTHSTRPCIHVQIIVMLRCALYIVLDVLASESMWSTQPHTYHTRNHPIHKQHHTQAYYVYSNYSRLAHMDFVLLWSAQMDCECAPICLCSTSGIEDCVRMRCLLCVDPQMYSFWNRLWTFARSLNMMMVILVDTKVQRKNAMHI